MTQQQSNGNQTLQQFIQNQAALDDPQISSAHLLSYLSLVRQLVGKLQAAYAAGNVHANLIPQHIQLNSTGTPSLKDSDFISENGAGTETAVSTPYTAPEQREGAPLTFKSNIYAVGAILYELLAGQPPQPAISSWDIFADEESTAIKPIHEIKPTLPAAVVSIVNSCLRSQAWGRYDSYAELIAAIDAAIVEIDPQQSKRKAAVPFWQNIGQRRLFVAIPVGILLLALLWALLLRDSGRESENREQSLPATVTLQATAAGAGNEGDEPAVEAVVPATDTPTNAPAATATIPATITDEPATATQMPTAAATATEITLPTATVTDTGSSAPIATATATATPTGSPTPTNEPPSPSACVPSPPTTWIEYIIQPADTLFNLAQATNTTVERLQEVNCLQGTSLSVGDTLWLPQHPATATPTGPAATATPQDTPAPGTTPPPPNPTAPPPPTLTPPPPPGG